MIAQLRPNAFGNDVAGRDGEHRIDADLDVCVDPMPDPAGTNVLDAPHASYMAWRMLDLAEDVRLDAVDQPHPHGLRRTLDDEKDGDRDAQTDERIQDRDSQIDARNAYEHGEAGEPVHAGVLTVGDKSGRANFTAHLDP